MLRNERVHVKIVENMTELSQVLAVRAAVCLGELQWPFHEYQDGNDFSATQLLATVDGEPAGTMRIRYFGDFAKPEWLVVMGHYRRGRFGSRGVAWELAQHSFDLCRKKGFTRIYGHAAPEVESLWRKIAGPNVQTLTDAVSTGEAKGGVIPMLCDYEPMLGAIGLNSFATSPEGHLLFTRPEAELDRMIQ